MSWAGDFEEVNDFKSICFFFASLEQTEESYLCQSNHLLVFYFNFFFVLLCISSNSSGKNVTNSSHNLFESKLMCTCFLFLSVYFSSFNVINLLYYITTETTQYLIFSCFWYEFCLTGKFTAQATDHGCYIVIMAEYRDIFAIVLVFVLGLWKKIDNWISY